MENHHGFSPLHLKIMRSMSPTLPQRRTVNAEAELTPPSASPQSLALEDIEIQQRI